MVAGPFVDRVGPRGGRVRPLASVLDQQYWDTFDHLAALYHVATGRPAGEALLDHRRGQSAELARLSDSFVDALGPIGPPQREGQDLDAEYRRLAELWFAAVIWTPDMQLGGLWNRVFHVAWVCRKARDRGIQAWAWEGKLLPMYAIASGSDEASYREYRRQKRRH